MAIDSDCNTEINPFELAVVASDHVDVVLVQDEFVPEILALVEISDLEEGEEVEIETVDVVEKAFGVSASEQDDFVVEGIVDGCGVAERRGEFEFEHAPHIRADAVDFDFRDPLGARVPSEDVDVALVLDETGGEGAFRDQHGRDAAH